MRHIDLQNELKTFPDVMYYWENKVLNVNAFYAI